MESKIDEAKQWIKNSEEVLNNLGTFVKDIYAELPQDKKDLLDKELKTIDVKDISKSLGDITKELREFRNKYRG